MTKPETCGRPDCDRPAVVGWGPEPTWICLAHFEEAISEIRAKVDLLRQKPRPSVAERLSSRA